MDDVDTDGTGGGIFRKQDTMTFVTVRCSCLLAFVIRLLELVVADRREFVDPAKDDVMVDV